MRKIVAKANRPAYLANVLCIAKIGGDVAKPESLVLRSIIHSIGGTRDDVVAAGAMLLNGHYQLQVPESPNERLANLQDMIMVALADGNLSPLESAPIEKLAKAMGYAQVDMDLVVRHARNALQRIGRKPPSITREGNPPLIPVKPPARSAEVARTELEAPAPSPVAPPAVEDETTGAVAPPAPPEAAPAEEDPQPAEDTEPADESSDEVQDSLPEPVKACMQCRAESEHPETYCFGIPDGPLNPWGCRLSKMPWEPGAPWMEFGTFRDDATFLFNKHAIAERLTAHLSAVLSCPHLDTEYTEAAFDCFPERALIGPRWRHRAADADDPDAVTVGTTQYVQGCALTTRLSVDGVDPIGTRDAMKIMQKAARRL